MSINSKMCVIALCFYFLFHCLIVFTIYYFVDVLTNVSKNDLPQKKKNVGVFVRHMIPYWCPFIARFKELCTMNIKVKISSNFFIKMFYSKASLEGDFLIVLLQYINDWEIMTEEKLIISKRQEDKSLYRDPFARLISVSVVAFIQMTDLCQPGWEQAESEIVL